MRGGELRRAGREASLGAGERGGAFRTSCSEECRAGQRVVEIRGAPRARASGAAVRLVRCCADKTHRIGRLPPKGGVGECRVVLHLLVAVAVLHLIIILVLPPALGRSS